MSAYDVALRPTPGRPQDVELAAVAPATTVTLGELDPVILDGHSRLADALRARRLKQRRADEELLLLWTE